MRDQLRSASRSLLHRPALAAAVIVTLTLGIGANSAIFSAVDAVLLEPLPYPNADRLVSVYESNLARRQSTQLVAPGRLEEWNRMNQTFLGLAASYFENMTDTSAALPERVEAMRVSPRFFAVLGVPAAIGRTLNPQEELFGGPRAAVLSDLFWRKRFDANPRVIGQSLTLGGASYTIVGIMPPSFRYPKATTEVWLPTQAPEMFLKARGARLYTAIGRLKPGVTPEQGQADLSAVEARLAVQYPQTDAGWAAAVVPLKEEQIGGVRRSLWLLLGAVLLVLLAACGNVACLMLADATRREHEIAVRLALGASRMRVVAQLLLEGAMLALAGSCLGLLVAHWGLDLLRKMATQLPRADELGIDARIVVFTLTVGVMTTVLFALAPALQATRSTVASRLGHGGRGQIGGRQRLQRMLVATQIALAIVLLAGAGLLVRSFSRLQQVSPGFDSTSVLTFRVSSQWTESTTATMSRHLRTMERLNKVPGVVSSAFSIVLPAGADFPPIEFTIAGRDAREHLFSTSRSVSSAYFSTLHIPLLQGAVCRDDPAKPFRQVVVTRAWADRFFPGESPIGHFIEPLSLAGQPPQEIIAVVGDVRENGLTKEPPALMYGCGLQPYWPDPFFLVRTDPARHVSVQTIRAALREIEPKRALYSVRPLADTLTESISQQRLNTVLLVLFAGTALLLAAVGLYGVMSQFVSARQREIGVRMALGARPAQILSTIVGQAASVTAVGILVGIAGAFALARSMATLVFGVSTRDPITFTAVPLLLAIVAAAATVLPARRAARVDPMLALRDD
ncbi:MAG TPA: ABC transporter permease [Vicinamibacterales bacterium]